VGSVARGTDFTAVSASEILVGTAAASSRSTRPWSLLDLEGAPRQGDPGLPGDGSGGDVRFTPFYGLPADHSRAIRTSLHTWSSFCSRPMSRSRSSWPGRLRLDGEQISVQLSRDEADRLELDPGQIVYCVRSGSACRVEVGLARRSRTDTLVAECCTRGCTRGSICGEVTAAV
jgi:hypothetical protein